MVVKKPNELKSVMTKLSDYHSCKLQQKNSHRICIFPQIMKYSCMHIAVS